MTRASYLWRRDSAFWFQIAVPKDLRALIGRTPIRYRLPTTSSAEAARAARILAGSIERRFGEMRLLKYLQSAPGRSFASKIAGRLWVDDYFQKRDLLLEGFQKEIDEIFGAMDDAPLNTETGGTPNDLLLKRTKILENKIISLREKAKEITEDYADYYELSQDKIHEYRKMEEYKEENDWELFMEFKKLKQSSEDNQSKVDALDKERSKLHAQIVSEGDARQEVLEAAKLAMSGTDDVKYLVQRLKYQGPALSEGKVAFLADRRNRGIAEKEIKQLDKKLLDFIDLIGDKPVAAYSIGDIQRFAQLLTFLPERHGVDRRWSNMTLKEVIELHESSKKPRTSYLCEKTILTGYVSRIKSAIRWLCADNKVDYPFENAGNIAVMAQGTSVIRHGLPFETVEQLLRASRVAETPEDIWMPLVGLLTGVRLAELVFFQPTDFRRQNGTWIVDLTATISAPGRTPRRALKTENARRYIVMHQLLVDCGFVEWAQKQKEWVFKNLHDAKSPANAASKRFQRKFREWGLHGQDRAEVFHALRHTYKDWARSQKIEERTIALQTGHSLQGVALQYGTKSLRPDEMKQLSQMPLPAEWPVSLFKDITPRIDDIAYRERRDTHIKNYKLNSLKNNFSMKEQ